MKKVPEQVITLPEIGMVSCGFNHTLAVSIDGLTAFAFGDGDHGKLGLGHCTSRNSPTVIEGLEGKTIKKIGAGKNFSVFLTYDGQVLTCGFQEWTGLPESLSKLNKPCQILSLENVKIVDIGVGSEHVLALTDQGEVYGWGNNFNSQLGLEPGIYGDLVAKPILINFLNNSSASPIGNTTNSSTKNIQQVSAGNLHSVIYSSPLLTPKSLKSYGIPEKIPEKFETIQHIPVRDLQERLISLNEISNLVKTSWRLLPRDYTGGFTNNNKNIFDFKNQPLSLNSVRQILNPSVYQLPLVRTLQSTMTIGKTKKFAFKIQDQFIFSFSNFTKKILVLVWHRLLLFS